VKPHLSDTSADAERFLIEGYRRMSPMDKLRRVESLNRAVTQLQRARIRKQYGDISEDEMRMRIGALRLGRDLMIKAFGWDPDVQGW
jgi:hypothetical protein